MNKSTNDRKGGADLVEGSNSSKAKDRLGGTEEELEDSNGRSELTAGDAAELSNSPGRLQYHHLSLVP